MDINFNRVHYNSMSKNFTVKLLNASIVGELFMLFTELFDFSSKAENILNELLKFYFPDSPDRSLKN